MSVVFADSSCELDSKELKKIGIESINLKYKINTEKITYKAEKFDFEQYCSNNKIEIEEITTYESVKKLIMQAVNTKQEVIIITPSSEFFSTYDYAIKAKKEIENEICDAQIYVVNSETISIAYASLVYLAGILNSRGLGAKNLIEKLNDLINSTELLIVPSKINTEKIKLSVAGSMIGAKPVISFYNDKMLVVNNVKGQTKLISEIIKAIKTNGYNIADYPMGIVYGKNIEEVNLINNKIKDEFGDFNIWIKKYNPTICDLFGNNAILVCYHVKR